MAERNNRKRVRIVDFPQIQARSSSMRSYQDLSNYEVDRVNSALSAAANHGQVAQSITSKSCKDLEAINADSESDDSSPEDLEAPKILRRSSTYGSKQDDEDNEMEAPSGSSKSKKKDLFTITINRSNRHRLEKALTLLEYVEGGGSDDDSDCSHSSTASILNLNIGKKNNSTSTPRVQALKDRTSKNR